MQASLYSLLVKKENAHEDSIFCCAWARINPSKNSTEAPKDIIVTGGSLGEIKVWEWQSNKLIFQEVLQEHMLAITSLSLSPDGQTLVSTSMDFQMMVWDIVARQKIHSIAAPQIWRAAFGPDGVHVVAGCHTGDIVLYDIVKGNIVSVFDTRENFAIAVAWTPNDKFVASGSSTGAVCVLDSEHGKVIHTFKDHKESVKDIAFSPNSNLLLSGSADGTTKLYNIVAGTLLHSLELSSAVMAVCFCPDGKRVALGTADGEVVIALIDGLQVLKTYKEHQATVWQLQFSPKGDVLMSVSEDKTINVFEIPPIPKK